MNYHPQSSKKPNANGNRFGIVKGFSNEWVFEYRTREERDAKLKSLAS